MIKKFTILSSLCLLFSFSNQIFAQLLPPNQPEQDACNALILCGNTFTSPYGYQGVGVVNDLPSTPCGGGEGNTMWLRLEITSPGIIVFEIRPITVTDDYDFAIVDISNSNCNDFTSADVIRCNFNNNTVAGSNVNGIIGLNTTSTIQFVTGGFTGNSYLQQIDANAGDIYLIMVNNFGTELSGPVSGFTIDFTGSTAVFNQPPPPKFDKLVPACDLSQEIVLQLTDNVLCSSIAADGSDFLLSPSGSIQSVEGINCTGVSGYTNSIKITFNGPLPSNDYTLYAKQGSDGNSLLGLCNAELLLPDSINFHVGIDPIEILSLDSPACQTLKIHLNSPILCNTIAADGSDFKIVGPSNVSIASASGQGCGTGMTQTISINVSSPISVDGLYHLKSKVGSDGNTLFDSCGRVLPVERTIDFVINSYNGQLTALPDTAACSIGDTIHLYGVNNGTPPSGGFQYHWLPEADIINPGNLSTPAIASKMENHFILETVDINGCYLRDSNTIRVVPLNAEVYPKDQIGCVEDGIPLHASGGTSYQWFDNEQLTGIPSTLNCNLCPNPYAQPSMGDHEYFVLIKNDAGCEEVLKTTVHVKPLPEIQVQPKDTIIKYGDDLSLHATGGEFYIWYPMGSIDNPYSSDPVASPKKNTEYVVSGTDENGCMNYDTAFVEIDFRSPVFIPNSFTPNNDGLNDVFKIGNLQFQKLLSFKIFNRLGELVFETNDPKKGWDGNFRNKPAISDVYFYSIILGYPDEVTEEYKGDVTLIR